MTLRKLSKQINEQLKDKDIESIVRFISTLDKKDDIKKEVKQKFPRISDNDLELVLSLS